MATPAELEIDATDEQILAAWQGDAAGADDESTHQGAAAPDGTGDDQPAAGAAAPASPAPPAKAGGEGDPDEDPDADPDEDEDEPDPDDEDEGDDSEVLPEGELDEWAKNLPEDIQAKIRAKNAAARMRIDQLRGQREAARTARSAAEQERVAIRERGRSRWRQHAATPGGVCAGSRRGSGPDGGAGAGVAGERRVDGRFRGIGTPLLAGRPARAVIGAGPAGDGPALGEVVDERPRPVAVALRLPTGDEGIEGHLGHAEAGLPRGRVIAMILLPPRIAESAALTPLRSNSASSACRPSGLAPRAFASAGPAPPRLRRALRQCRFPLRPCFRPRVPSGAAGNGLHSGPAARELSNFSQNPPTIPFDLRGTCCISL